MATHNIAIMCDDPGIPGHREDREALILSTRALFDSLLKGSSVILQNQKALHAACEAASAAALVTRDEIIREETSLLKEKQCLERKIKEYESLLEQGRAELSKESEALRASSANEAKLLNTMEDSMIALDAVLKEQVDKFSRIVMSKDLHSASMSALQGRLDEAQKEVELTKRQLSQKARGPSRAMRTHLTLKGIF